MKDDKKIMKHTKNDSVAGSWPEKTNSDGGLFEFDWQFGKEAAFLRNW